MKLLTVVRRGSSLCLPVSKEDFKLDQKWLLVPKNNGGYELVPKVEDPYSNPDFENQYEPDEWDDLEFDGDKE